MTLVTTSSTFSSIPANFAVGATAPVLVPAPLKSRTKDTARALPVLAKTKVWGCDFAQIDMPGTLRYIDAIVEQKIPEYLITANLNYLMLCDRIPRLAEFTKKSALTLCDGMPIYWRSKLNVVKLPERVAGADLIFSLAERCADKGYRLFLMGGAEGVAEQAAVKLREMHPKLTIAGVECPPFRPLSSDEHQALCNRIREAKPDVLLIAFGQPKGEFWIEENYQSLGVPLSIQLGASFDFIVGTAKRAPVALQKLGLEWLYRACHDPKRLFPRYMNNAWFLLKSLRRDLLDYTRG
jgi:N-acetylglucosaminyldiphosphoundecaprenol N-acetyl-beta-D-mannosaminyltransferase